MFKQWNLTRCNWHRRDTLHWNPKYYWQHLIFLTRVESLSSFLQLVASLYVKLWLKMSSALERPSSTNPPGTKQSRKTDVTQAGVNAFEENFTLLTWGFTSPPSSSDSLKKVLIFPWRNWNGKLKNHSWLYMIVINQSMKLANKQMRKDRFHIQNLCSPHRKVPRFFQILQRQRNELVDEVVVVMF